MRSRITMTILAAMAGSMPAMADVTAEQVWNDMTACAAHECTVTGTAETVESGLLIREASVQLGADDERVNVSVPEIMLQENDDGSVTVSVPSGATFSMNGEPIALTGKIMSGNFSVDVSGKPGDLTYESFADTVSTTLSSDPSTGDESMEMSVDITGLSSTVIRQDEITTGDLAADSVDITASGAGGEGETFALSLTLDDVAEDFEIDMSDPENVHGAFAFGIAGASGGFNSKAGEDVSEGAFTVGESAIATEVESGMASVSAEVNELQSSMTATGLPGEISYAIAENSITVVVPTGSAKSQHFALDYVLRDMTLPGEIWALIDPSGVLDRGPVSLELASSGLVDTTGDDWLPESLEVSGFSLSALGARLSGSGAATMDTDGSPEDGFAVLSLSGANAVLGAIEASGAVPAEMTGAARAMIGMFTRPVPGTDDEVRTELTFEPQGVVKVNGQQM